MTNELLARTDIVCGDGTLQLNVERINGAWHLVERHGKRLKDHGPSRTDDRAKTLRMYSDFLDECMKSFAETGQTSVFIRRDL